MIEDLPVAQDEMLQRNLANKSLAENVCVMARERRKAEQTASRNDLICPWCDQQPTTASRRTGKLNPCGKCKKQRPALSKLGSSLKELATWMRVQDNKCASCGYDFDNNRKATTATLDKASGLDLDHVRGAVHDRCRELLRLSSYDSGILENHATYLRENRTKRTRQWRADRDGTTQIWD